MGRDTERAVKELAMRALLARRVEVVVERRSLPEVRYSPTLNRLLITIPPGGADPLEIAINTIVCSRVRRRALVPSFIALLVASLAISYILIPSTPPEILWGYAIAVGVAAAAILEIAMPRLCRRAVGRSGVERDAVTPLARVIEVFLRAHASGCRDVPEGYECTRTSWGTVLKRRRVKGSA